MISITLTGGTAAFMGFFLVVCVMSIFLGTVGLIMRLEGSHKQL